MGKVINWPGQKLCPAGRSAGSRGRKTGRRACVVPLRSRGPTTPEGFAPSETTSQPVDAQDQGLGPSRLVNPRSEICPEALAFRELIMDDKSMQPWTTLPLTLPEPPRTIRVVGRPPEKVTPAGYRAAFYKRVRTAREFYTEDYREMARALGIAEGTYYRYETRTMLPHHLIPRFCQITGVSADWLFHGPAAARALSSRPATGTDPS